MADEVKSYISKQTPEKQEVIEKLRKIVQKTLLGIKEYMKWGVICYEDLYYIVALKDYVNLGFSIVGLTKDEASSFKGAGKTMKHLSIKSAKDVDEKKIADLIKLVKSKCRPVHK